MPAGHIAITREDFSSSPLLIEEKATWLQFFTTKDPAVRLQLIDTYLPYARMLAAKLYGGRQGLDAPFEDYLHYAVLALIQSVDRFDPTLGPHFKTFAHYRIEGMILNELPRLSEQHAQVGLINRLRKERIESLADENIETKKHKSKGFLFEEMVEMAVGLSIGYMLEGSGMYREDDQPDNHDGYAVHAVKELSTLMQKLVELLPDNEKTVIKFHYFLALDMQEIAIDMKLSKGRISQLHKQGLQKLKKMAETVGLNLHL